VKHSVRLITNDYLDQLADALDSLASAEMSLPQLDRFAWELQRGEALSLARVRNKPDAEEPRKLIPGQGYLHDIECTNDPCRCLRVWPA
jgi:hypothetical protein